MKKTSREQIRILFGEFIDCLEKNDLSKFDSIFTNDVKGYFSTVGLIIGCSNMKEKLKWPGPKMNVSKSSISNFVSFNNKETGCLTANVFVLKGHDSGKQLYPFQYGGRYVCTCIKEKNIWKINEVRYDFEWECGNSYFAKDWEMIDYKIFSGHKQMIVSEFESPWAIIEDAEESLSEEEKVAEALYRYAFSLDKFDISLMMKAFSPDIEISMPHGVFKGLREVIAYYKFLRCKEACMQHNYKPVKIDVKGNKAKLLGYRMEPNRLGTKVLSRDTMNYKYYSAKFYLDLEKIDGIWMVNKIDYKGGVFFEIDEEIELFVDNNITQ